MAARTLLAAILICAISLAEAGRSVNTSVQLSKGGAMHVGAYAMAAPEFGLMQGMTDQQRMVFLGHYNAVRKDVTVGVLLALFLGGFGAHRFYMGQIGLGILYLVFVWTGVPSLVALVECFLMPNRVRDYNWTQANFIAAQTRASFPA